MDFWNQTKQAFTGYFVIRLVVGAAVATGAAYAMATLVVGLALSGFTDSQESLRQSAAELNESIRSLDRSLREDIRSLRDDRSSFADMVAERVANLASQNAGQAAELKAIDGRLERIEGTLDEINRTRRIDYSGATILRDESDVQRFIDAFKGSALGSEFIVIGPVTAPK